MAVLVAGGAGFIGSHLCKRLLREGYVTICLVYANPQKEDAEHTWVEGDRAKKELGGDPQIAPRDGSRGE